MAAQKKTYCLLALTIVALISSVSGILPSRVLAEGATIGIDITKGAATKTNAYDPNPAHANVGDTVIWTNRDSTLHTAAAGTPLEGPTGEFGGTFDTLELIPPSGTQSYTPDEEGEFPYYCVLHPNMVGILIVGGGGEGLAVEADKLTYEIGDLVTIIGSVPDVQENQTQILLSIADQDGQLLRIDPVPIDASGNFFYKFVIGGPLVQAGMTYDVTATYAGEVGSTSFRVAGPKDTAGTCQDLAPTIKGTEANDVINGTSGPDIIVGLGGDDTIRGFAGDDLICGGPGEDWLSGGLDDDKIFGGRGSDFLFGLAGDDRLWGGTGYDRMFGGADDDTMFGGKGRDNMKSGGGDDRLDGQEGDDIIDGVDEGFQGDPTNIVIEDLEEVLSPGDELELIGHVEDPELGLDEVTITIVSPDGGDDSEVVGLDGGEFFLDYELDFDAPDGVHTVEVEYGNDVLFSYFLVDDEEDELFVTTEEFEYRAGEELIVFGEAVDLEVEDDVFITIRGPGGEYLAFQELADSDADSFEFAGDLDDSALVGRYSIIATSGAANGYALFEVEAGASNSPNIEFELEFDYDPGDNIDVDGSIDDREFGFNEVTITVDSPDGNSESDIVDLDDVEFFFEFELETGAVDGIYVVEVEYAGESRFGYFLVNEDNDEIEVETDSDEYDPGESVEVFGTVNDPVTGEDEVEIHVQDPNGDLIVDGVNVDLDSNDEFEYEFDLDEDAPAGRYAISVEYDGETLGFWLFEVE